MSPRIPPHLAVAAVLVLAAAASATPPPLALVGATLVDGTGAAPVADSVVVLEGGSVACAGPRAACPVPDGVQVVDVAGRFVVPGLVDARVRLSRDGSLETHPEIADLGPERSAAAADAGLRDRPERLLGAQLCAGVTAVLDLGGPPWTWELSARAAREPRAPRVVASGPGLSTFHPRNAFAAELVLFRAASVDEAPAAVRYVGERGAALVRVVASTPAGTDPAETEATIRAAVEEATTRGLRVVGEVARLADAKAAVRAGVAVLAGPPVDAPADDELVALARERGTIVLSSLGTLPGYGALYEAAARGTAPAVVDPLGCVDAELRARLAAASGHRKAIGEARLSEAAIAELQARLATQGESVAEGLRRFHRAGVPVALGSDSGAPWTLHGAAVHAEAAALAKAGFTPTEVLLAATATAARAAGLTERHGSIEPGKSADLLVLAADPTADVAALRDIVYVVRGGAPQTQAELRRWTDPGEP